MDQSKRTYTKQFYPYAEKEEDAKWVNGRNHSFLAILELQMHHAIVQQWFKCYETVASGAISIAGFAYIPKLQNALHEAK